MKSAGVGDGAVNAEGRHGHLRLMDRLAQAMRAARARSAPWLVLRRPLVAQRLIAAPVDATIVYYGNVKRTRERLAALAGPVLGHFATRDRWINQEMVDGFEAEMAAAGKSAENHWYEADHGFANPTSARYDEEDAALAWRRTLAFFEAHLM